MQNNANNEKYDIRMASHNIWEIKTVFDAKKTHHF